MFLARPSFRHQFVSTEAMVSSDALFVERMQRLVSTHGASPLWTVHVVRKDTRKLVATFRSLNFFNALHMKEWWVDNGVPCTDLGDHDGIEVLLDRWPPIPTDLADEVA